MSEFAPSRVVKDLYISGIFGVTEENLVVRNIKLVLNLTYDTPVAKFANVRTDRIEIDDLPTVKIIDYFTPCSDLIDDYLEREEGVLVHCMAGVSRSATIILAYLMRHRHMNLREAHNYLRKCRPQIKPNSGFFEQLIEYEMSLFGKTSVKMVQTSLGSTPEIYLMEQDSGLGYFLPLSNPNKVSGQNAKQLPPEKAAVTEGSSLHDLPGSNSNITMPPGPQQKFILSSNSPNKVIKSRALRVPSPTLKAVANEADNSSASETTIKQPLPKIHVPSSVPDSGTDADDEMSLMSINKTHK